MKGAQQRVQEAQTFQIPTGKNQQKSAQADVAQAYGSFQAKGSLPVFLPYTYFSIPFHELSRIFETHGLIVLMSAAKLHSSTQKMVRRGELL
jgi:hypothetical protein